MYNVQADDAAAGFGVCVHTDPGYEAGMELRIEPGKRRLAGSHWLSGVREIASLEVIVKGDVRTWRGERRTLTPALPRGPRARVSTCRT